MNTLSIPTQDVFQQQQHIEVYKVTSWVQSMSSVQEKAPVLMLWQKVPFS